MHRYRDAITYSKDDRRNSIEGAFVLFPYNDEKQYKNQKFYKTIETVKIGAIPFLPSSTEIMRKFLEEIINGETMEGMNKDITEVEKVKEKILLKT